MGPTGWVAAPAPGLFPLRPLNFGEVLGTTFKLLRTNAAVSVGSGLIINAVTSLLMIAGPLLTVIWAADRLARAGGEDGLAIALGFPFWLLLSMVPGFFIGLLGSALLQVIIAQVVAAAAVNRPLSFGQAWRRATQRMWAMIGYILLMGLIQLGIVLVAGGLGALLVFWSFSSSAGGDPNVGVIVSVIVLMFVIILALTAAVSFFQIKLLFGPSAIALENLGPGAALKRSWRLSNKYFWRTLGTVLVLGIIISVVTQVIGLLGSVFIPLFTQLLVPFGDAASGQEPVVTGLAIFASIVMVVFSTLVSTLTLILTSGNAVIMYADLRMRKEGLNIHLQRTAEQVAAGEPVEPEPWTAPDLGPAPEPAQPAYTGPQSGYPAPPYPQPYPGQPYSGQPHPGQPYPGQSYAGPQYPSQTYPDPQYPSQSYSDPQYPSQQFSNQPYASQPAAPQPGPAPQYDQPVSPYGSPRPSGNADTDRTTGTDAGSGDTKNTGQSS